MSLDTDIDVYNLKRFAATLQQAVDELQAKYRGAKVRRLKGKHKGRICELEFFHIDRGVAYALARPYKKAIGPGGHWYDTTETLNDLESRQFQPIEDLEFV